jgi:hypothetical protein
MRVYHDGTAEPFPCEFALSTEGAVTTYKQFIFLFSLLTDANGRDLSYGHSSADQIVLKYGCIALDASPSLPLTKSVSNPPT